MSTAQRYAVAIFFEGLIFPGMTPLDQTLARVEAYLKRTGTKATNFGISCSGNPALVRRLRRTNVTARTLGMVVEYLDRVEKGVRRKALGARNGRV